MHSAAESVTGRLYAALVPVPHVGLVSSNGYLVEHFAVQFMGMAKVVMVAQQVPVWGAPVACVLLTSR